MPGSFDPCYISLLNVAVRKLEIFIEYVKEEVCGDKTLSSESIRWSPYSAVLYVLLVDIEICRTVKDRCTKHISHKSSGDAVGEVALVSIYQIRRSFREELFSNSNGCGRSVVSSDSLDIGCIRLQCVEDCIAYNCGSAYNVDVLEVLSFKVCLLIGIEFLTYDQDRKSCCR